MNGFAGTAVITRLALRRDRIMLPAWVYLITAGLAGTALSFRKLYPTAAGRAAFAVTGGGNPALRFLSGRLYGSSTGALTAWRYGIWAAIFGALLTAATANVAVAILLCLALPLAGLPAAGSVALALAIAASGLAFTGIAGVAAQLASGARGARGLAVGVLGAAFVLRAIGDSAGPGGPAWLTWASPLGWVELTRPFGGPRWWVLALFLGLAAGGPGPVARCPPTPRGGDGPGRFVAGWRRPGAWTVLGVVVAIDLFGQALGLSHWLLDVSPFTHAPRLPGGPVSAAPLLWLSLVAVAFAAVGLSTLRRRDLG